MHFALADPRGGPGTPPGVQILSFSCSFRQKVEKIIPLWELGLPSSGKSWIRHCFEYTFYNQTLLRIFINHTYDLDSLVPAILHHSQQDIHLYIYCTPCQTDSDSLSCNPRHSIHLYILEQQSQFIYNYIFNEP